MKLLLLTFLLAAGEQNGRIRGTITEAETQLAVPGAQVTATGDKLIGGPQTVQSNEDGTYNLVELPPGSYELEITYAGVAPIKRKVSVRQGETVTLDIEWSAQLTEAEVTEVVEERRLTRPDSTSTGTVISFDTAKKLATQRSYTDVAQTVAGMKSDRGLPVVKGANRLQNRFIVDGMDITDSSTNNFASGVNFDSISSLEVLTGGMEAQYNALGGVINVNTNSGSDEFHLDTSVYVNNAAFSANNIYSSQAAERELLFSDVKTGPTQSYNLTFNVSGPIIKQKLWYGVSFEYAYEQRSLVTGPPLNVRHPSRADHLFRPRVKIVWAPEAKHRITWSTSGDPAFVYNRQQSNSLLGVAENGQSQGGFFTVAQWDYFHSPTLSTNTQLGYNLNTLNQQPICSFFGGAFVEFGARDPRFSERNYKCDADAAQRRNLTDGTTWYSSQQRNTDFRHTVQFDPTVSLRGEYFGDHDAKFGIQARYVSKNFRQSTPGGAIYSDNNGQLLEAGLCDPNTGIGCTTNSRVTYAPAFTNNSTGFGIGFFAQDRWKPIKRLTILPGMRLDYGITKNSVGQTVTNSWGVGPRLGVTFDITGDQKTIATAYYGRANETLTLLPALFADPRATTEVQRWDPSANGGAGGYTLQNRTGGSDGYRLRPNSTTPHTDEITFGLNRELMRDSVASIAYTYKRVSNMWQEVEVNQIWDPSGQRVIGFADGNPRQVSLFTTRPEAYRNYHGIDLSAEARPDEHWDLYAGYTLSWLFGPGSETVRTVGGGNQFQNPRQQAFFDGFLPEDVRHNLKMRASYTWKGLSVGATMNFATGTPLTKLFFNQQTGSYTNRRSPAGSAPGANGNDWKTIANFRVPDQLIITLRASYDLHEHIGQHLTLIADVFNLLNLDTPVGLETRDLPTFGQANQGRLAPFKVQLALRYML